MLLRYATGVQFSSGRNSIDVDDMLVPVDGVENAPVTDSVLDQTGEVLVQGFMPKVGDIRGEPFGLIQETLSHVLVGCLKVVQDRGQIGDTIPGHVISPAEAESFGDGVPRHPIRGGQRLLQLRAHLVVQG